jgi:hypothetical protein
MRASHQDPTADHQPSYLRRADPGRGVPQFPLVLRGYDRQLVDARVAELAERLAAERERSQQAEQALRQLQAELQQGRHQLPAWFAELGEEVSKVVQEAGLAAGRLLTEAGKRAQQAVDAAQAQAAERLGAAEQQANALEQAARQRLADAEATQARLEVEANEAAQQRLAQAEREGQALLTAAKQQADTAWQQAAKERQRLQLEAEQLTAHRQAMVEQLARVYAPLGLTLVDTRGLPAPNHHAGPAEPAESVQDAAPTLPASAIDPGP